MAKSRIPRRSPKSAAVAGRMFLVGGSQDGKRDDVRLVKAVARSIGWKAAVVDPQEHESPIYPPRRGIIQIEEVGGAPVTELLQSRPATVLRAVEKVLGGPIDVLVLGASSRLWADWLAQDLLRVYVRRGGRQVIALEQAPAGVEEFSRWILRWAKPYGSRLELSILRMPRVPKPSGRKTMTRSIQKAFLGAGCSLITPETLQRDSDRAREAGDALAGRLWRHVGGADANSFIAVADAKAARKVKLPTVWWENTVLDLTKTGVPMVIVDVADQNDSWVEASPERGTPDAYRVALDPDTTLYPGRWYPVARLVCPSGVLAMGSVPGVTTGFTWTAHVPRTATWIIERFKAKGTCGVRVRRGGESRPITS